MPYLIILSFLLLSTLSTTAYSSECKLDSKITGFTSVKPVSNGRAYFYKEPKLCEKGKTCRSIRKAYLISNDFVQTAHIDGQFVCAIFNNSHSSSGKQTFGWLLLKDLNPIRTKLNINDLPGIWWQIPCQNDDDCGIFISTNKNGTLEIDIAAHLHERPSSSFNVHSIKKVPGKLLLRGEESGDRNVTELVLVFNGKNLEPGTIELKGNETFEGTYYK